ncbi:MAG: 4-hydroxybutyrate CoA-transferase, partial [Anaerolineae bacterium]|nr:4-hydroxybutyrate CoA-transferase [Anaerolineae bacterium]NIN97805.1 4-hydroxybutyrate CoA-transferase [Anaerolineae bacterium]NIQ80801.1 4-hydroxybutyrate CoA-transferase [Anaerolineae bacterium]
METVPWQQRYSDKVKTARQALRIIERGDSVFIGSGAAEPQLLVAELAKMSMEFADTEIVHLWTLGLAPYTQPKFKCQFRHNAFFIGDNVRQAVAEGLADYTPIFLSEIPQLFISGRRHVDVALIQVTPPNEHGFCSYGVSVDIVKPAAEHANWVIAEVNPQMPWTLGDSFVHVNSIDALVENDTPILELRYPEPDEIAKQIGENIARLIDDGATLQMGIGTIPDSILASLHNKRDLGIHTEMLSDGVTELVEAGVITNAKKTLHRGKIIASFVMGTKRLYDWVDHNPFIEFHPSHYVNDPFVVSQNDNMVAINSALEVDLTGQVCSDSIGYLFYSGIGGQVDMIRGSARSKGGKPVIALPSTAQDGTVSRIVSRLCEGAGVVTTRGDVHYVVTEYGTAYLHGKNIRERALALINIAHPDFRKQLPDEAKVRKYAFVDQLPPLGVYPAELEKRVTLRDGTEVLLRPIKPTDERMEQELFYSPSDRSIYRRSFSSIGAMPHERVQYYTTIDYEDQIAIVAILEDGSEEQMI